MLFIQRKNSFVERNTAPHTHNFPNLESQLNSSKTFFLRNFHVVIKIHLPLPLKCEVKSILDQNRSHIVASFTGKNKLKVFT